MTIGSFSAIGAILKPLRPLLVAIPWYIWLLVALLPLLYFLNRHFQLRDRWPRWGPVLIHLQVALAGLVVMAALGFMFSGR